MHWHLFIYLFIVIPIGYHNGYRRENAKRGKAFQKVANCPLEWSFWFLKCLIICRGWISLDNVASTTAEKFLPVLCIHLNAQYRYLWLKFAIKYLLGGGFGKPKKRLALLEQICQELLNIEPNMEKLTPLGYQKN